MPSLSKDTQVKKTIKEVHQSKIAELKQIKNQIKSRLDIKGDPLYYDMVLGRRVLNDGERIIVAEAYGLDPNQVAWLEKSDRIV